MLQTEAARLEKIINEQVVLYDQTTDEKTALRIAWCIGELKTLLFQHGYQYRLDEEKRVHIVWS